MQQKEQYISPLSEVLELRLKRVIAASGDPRYNKPFNDEQNWEE